MNSASPAQVLRKTISVLSLEQVPRVLLPLYTGSHFSIIETAMADTCKVRSFPILAYFLKNKLPNRVVIHFNAKEKDADSWIVYPVSAGKSCITTTFRLPHLSTVIAES